MKTEKNLKFKNGCWHIDFTMTLGKQKKRFREFGGYTKRQAQDRLNQLKAEKSEERRNLRNGIVKKEDITFAEFAEKKFLPTDQTKERREKTILSHKTSLSTLNAYFGDKLLSHITKEDVDGYIAERKKAKVRKKSKSGFKVIERTISNASINREITFLKQVLKLACKYGYIRINPAADAEKFAEPARWRILADDEVKRLLDAASPKLNPILRLLVTTGMRKNEVLRLRWAFPGYGRHVYQNEKDARSVIDLKERLIFIPAELAKNHKSRKIPLSLDLIDMLKQMQRASSKGEVFRIKDIKRSFDNAKKKAKIDRLRIHDLRHTAASRMIEAGVNVVDVCEILGHSDLKITMKYCHASSEKKRLAIEKLSEIYGDSRQKVDIKAPEVVIIRPISPEKLLN
jgi:integrase